MAWVGGAGEPPGVDSSEKHLVRRPPGVRLVQGNWKECFSAPDPFSSLLLPRWGPFLTRHGQPWCPDHWFGAVLWSWTGDLRWGMQCRLQSHPVTVILQTTLWPTIWNTCYTKHLIHTASHTQLKKKHYKTTLILTSYKIHCIKLKKKKKPLWLQIGFVTHCWIARHHARWAVVLAHWWFVQAHRSSCVAADLCPGERRRAVSFPLECRW